jgi:hypothetical protein
MVLDMRGTIRIAEARLSKVFVRKGLSHPLRDAACADALVSREIRLEIAAD